MLNRSDLLRAIIGLKEANDLDLVGFAVVLDEITAEKDKLTVLEMASIVEAIYQGFNYEVSPEFVTKIAGKSESARAMHRKLLDSHKRSEAKERLGKALTTILESDAAFQLVAPENHHLVDNLRSLVESIEVS